MRRLVLPGERTGNGGKPISNQILLSLGEREFEAIRSRLRLVTLKHHAVLHESNHKTEDVYFPDDGLISLVIPSSNGKTAEAGVVGNEGLVGLEGLFGLKRSPLREVVQIGGTAHRVPCLSFQQVFQEFPDLLFRFGRFAVVNRLQISQTAACNRLHKVNKRLAPMAAHGAGPRSGLSNSNDSRFSRYDAGHRPWRCYRSSCRAAKTSPDRILTRFREDSESQGPRESIVRVLFPHSRI
jgi:CRP-like cAMP-binding protein